VATVTVTMDSAKMPVAAMVGDGDDVDAGDGRDAGDDGVDSGDGRDAGDGAAGDVDAGDGTGRNTVNR